MSDDVLAYFITWTCYGTHLPGDERGWTKWQQGNQIFQPQLEQWCRSQMSDTAVMLDVSDREIVEQVIHDHCAIRAWKLHAVNCRSNHCHVVVTAPNVDGEQVRDQFKSWATLKLKAYQLAQGDHADVGRQHWWTRKGSVRKLYDQESLEAAIVYTVEAQDTGGSKAN